MTGPERIRRDIQTAKVEMAALFLGTFAIGLLLGVGVIRLLLGR